MQTPTAMTAYGEFTIQWAAVFDHAARMTPCGSPRRDRPLGRWLTRRNQRPPGVVRCITTPGGGKYGANRIIAAADGALWFVDKPAADPAVHHRGGIPPSLPDRASSGNLLDLMDVRRDLW